MIIASAVSPISNLPNVGSPINGGTNAAGAGWRPTVEAAKGESGQSPSVRATEGTGRAQVTEGESASKAQNNALAEELSPQELRILDQLKQTDREVRQHELAHQVAGGPYTGSAQYEYKMGPDGQRYAVAGKVSVDYGPVTGDPRATVEKMNVVIGAALAPADPSPADYQIAARARQYLLMAQLELSQQQTDATSLMGGVAANDDQSAEAGLSQDIRVKDYDVIAAATGNSGAETAQASLRSVA